MLLPTLFAIGVIALVVGATRSAKAAKAPGGGGEVPSLPPASIPGPATGTPLPKEVVAAAEAVKNGTATPELVADAIEAAHDAGVPGAATKLAEEFDKLVNETIPEIVRSPDRPGGTFTGSGPTAKGSGVPTNPDDGKTLWYPEVKSGVRMMLPRYRSVLVQFQSLQRVLKVKDDGRIGPGTLAAFQKATSDFPKAPRTLEALAANAVKWTEVLRGKFGVASVAGPFA